LNGLSHCSHRVLGSMSFLVATDNVIPKIRMMPQTIIVLLLR